MHELLRLLEQRVSRIEKKVDKLFWVLLVYFLGQVTLTNMPHLSSALSGILTTIIGEIK